MNEKRLSEIQFLLESGDVEDVQGALELASFHLKQSTDKEADFEIMITGIKKDIPIPYIIGYTMVCGTKIIINKNVLNPGPETITIIKMAQKHINNHCSCNVLDLCTGSGAVAVSLAQNRNAHLIATDISTKALSTARINAAENNLTIIFLQGDLFEPVTGRLFDVIVTNPPYVKTGEIKKLPGFIRDFAPSIAIDGGDDGLFFHRVILSKARNFICPDGGSLFMECEDDQDKDIEKLAINYKWKVEDKFPNRHGKIRGFRLT